MFARLLGGLSGGSAANPRSRNRVRLSVEWLEEHIAPAVIDFTVNVPDDTKYVQLGLNQITQQMAPLDANGNTSLRAVIEYGALFPQNGDWNSNRYNVDLTAITGVTITLDSGVGFQTLVLNTNFNFLATAGNVTVERSGAPNTPNFRLVSLSANTESHFTGMTFQNGRVFANGGGVLVAGTGVFEGCTFNANQARGMGSNGGAIAVAAGGSLTVSNCTFTYNEAGDDGGAIAGLKYSIGITIINSTFTNANSALRNGGAISVIGYIPDPIDPDPNHPFATGSLSISGSNINNNVAGGFGGGVYVQDLPTSANITETTIADNVAGDLGGGLYVLNSDLTMSGGSLTNNTGTNGGGGFYIDADGKTVTLDQVSVTNNKAPNGKGGGGYLLKGSLVGTLTALTGNTSGVAGFAGIVLGAGSTGVIGVPAGQQQVVADVAEEEEEEGD